MSREKEIYQSKQSNNYCIYVNLTFVAGVSQLTVQFLEASTHKLSTNQPTFPPPYQKPNIHLQLKTLELVLL